MSPELKRATGACGLNTSYVTLFTLQCYTMKI